MSIENSPTENDDKLTPFFSHAGETLHESQIPLTPEELTQAASEVAASLVQFQQTLEKLPTAAIVEAAKEKIIAYNMGRASFHVWREISILFSRLSGEEIKNILEEVNIVIDRFADEG